MTEARQRWRLIFRRDAEAMYLSHLDAAHAWERALRRGAIPVATTEGFNPRPKLIFAAPLQLGFVAEHELADLTLSERLTLADLRTRLAGCLPRGYEVVDLYDVWVGEPSLAPQLAAADYRLDLIGVGPDELRRPIARLLEADALPRERRREKRTIRYDLRPLLTDLRLRDADLATPTNPIAANGTDEGAERPTEPRPAATEPATEPGPAAPEPATELATTEPSAGIWMRLRHSQEGGTGRPEEIVAALADDLGVGFSWTGSDDEREETDPSGPAALDSRGRRIEIAGAVRERLWLRAELGE